MNTKEGRSIYCLAAGRSLSYLSLNLFLASSRSFTNLESSDKSVKSDSNIDSSSRDDIRFNALDFIRSSRKVVANSCTPVVAKPTYI